MRELERLLRGRRFPPPADAETASAPLARLGPGVVVYPEVVVIDGVRFPRRQYRREPPLDPLPARRPLDPTWESQLDHLSPPAALEAAIPDEGEIFTYISPTMARILRRIATVDSAHGFVLLVGPTGCGKTTLAKTYCWLTRQPLTELTFSGDTTLTDFYRSVEVVRDAQGRQSTVTVPGPAVEAMLRGKKLLINEINMLPPDILTVFTQAMDTGRLILSGTQRGNIEINVHRAFGIIGTANPHYIGTLDIGRAMERRFGRGLGYIEMTFLPPEEEAAAVANEFSRLALFARHNLTAPQDLCLRLATLAARQSPDGPVAPDDLERLVPPPPDWTVQHAAPATFRPGQPLRLSLTVGTADRLAVTLHYRPLNQALEYQSVEMEAEGARYRAAIPAAETQTPYPLQYYFVLRDDRGRAALFPGLGPDLANAPGFVVWPARA